jgi:hypothetical protein
MLITIKKLLEDELRRSIQNNSLTERFKQIVFYTVHNALIQFYGSNYSTRCLQSTLGIRLILQKFEINSVFVEGSVCFGLVFGKNPYILG